jgi:hypothetical protein
MQKMELVHAAKASRIGKKSKGIRRIKKYKQQRGGFGWKWGTKSEERD